MNALSLSFTTSDPTISHVSLSSFHLDLQLFPLLRISPSSSLPSPCLASNLLRTSTTRPTPIRPTPTALRIPPSNLNSNRDTAKRVPTTLPVVSRTSIYSRSKEDSCLLASLGLSLPTTSRLLRPRSDARIHISSHSTGRPPTSSTASSSEHYAAGQVPGGTSYPPSDFYGGPQQPGFLPSRASTPTFAESYGGHGGNGTRNNEPYVSLSLPLFSILFFGAEEAEKGRRRKEIRSTLACFDERRFPSFQARLDSRICHSSLQGGDGAVSGPRLNALWQRVMQRDGTEEAEASEGSVYST